jgi:hypothetical protein
MVRRASRSSDPNATIASIQRRINLSLERDLEDTLGARFFVGIRFRLVGVTLPDNVQAAVDETQAKYAGVNGARADVKQARYLARRNRLLGDAYNRSPALARIDAIKAVPPGTTLILPTGSQQPSIIAGK